MLQRKIASGIELHGAIKHEDDAVEATLNNLMADLKFYLAMSTADEELGQPRDRMALLIWSDGVLGDTFVKITEEGFIAGAFYYEEDALQIANRLEHMAAEIRRRANRA